MVCSTGRTSPDSSALLQVGLIDSHAQQPPSISSASAATLILEVPLYPSIIWIGTAMASWISFGTSSVVEPGAVPPSFTGRLDLNHSSTLLMPLALVSTQTPESGVGTPSQPNFRPSNFAALFPSASWRINGPI